MVKSKKTLIAAAIVGTFLLASCSYLYPAKKYKLELSVKCPDDKQIEIPIPEVLLT